MRVQRKRVKEMKKQIKERYIKELEEMSNNELLFEFEFCCTEVERLRKLINNGSYEQQLLSCEMERKRICNEVIINRMGGDN